MIEKIAFTTPTFGYMEMELIDPKNNIFTADRVGKAKVTYDNDHADQLFIGDALDIFWDELPSGLKEKIEYLGIPSVDQIIGENHICGFENRNKSRIRFKNDKSKGEMWWTSTIGVAKFTHFLVDTNGGLISDANDRQEAGFLPIIKLKRDVL